MRINNTDEWTESLVQAQPITEDHVERIGYDRYIEVRRVLSFVPGRTWWRVAVVDYSSTPSVSLARHTSASARGVLVHVRRLRRKFLVALAGNDDNELLS